jgi:hypothetical protein
MILEANALSNFYQGCAFARAHHRPSRPPWPVDALHALMLPGMRGWFQENDGLFLVILNPAERPGMPSSKPWPSSGGAPVSNRHLLLFHRPFLVWPP